MDQAHDIAFYFDRGLRGGSQGKVTTTGMAQMQELLEELIDVSEDNQQRVDWGPLHAREME